MNRQPVVHGSAVGGLIGTLFLVAGVAGCSSGGPADDGRTGSAGLGSPGAFGTGGATGSFGTPTNGGAGTGTPVPPPGASVGGSGVFTAGTGGSTGIGVVSATGNKLPCDVSKAVANNCQMCHGAMPIGGAPMSLVTWDDFHADHMVRFYAPLKGQTLKVYDLAKTRIDDMMSPMPPGGGMASNDFSVLDAWLAAGAPPGTDEQCAMDPEPTTADPTDGSYGPLTALPGETCYDLKVHGGLDSVDDSKYAVPPGEEYVQFYYDVPWETGALGSRYGTRFDQEAVLHHWLLFTTDSTNNGGYWEVAPLPTLLGDTATLLAGWAVGGSNLGLPSDAGFDLPAKGTKVQVQWHFYNTGSSDVMDSSAVQICTVPAGSRPHVVSITWIGNEDLGGNKWAGGQGMPPHQASTFEGTCDPLREGMNATDPIHILGFWPHMHKLGVKMESIINHTNGTSETVFTKAFDFNHQIHYMQNVDLLAGDTITARCYFNNTTDQGVPFGESSDTEMCYNFTMAWPAHALENHVISLIGATNTCWE